MKFRVTHITDYRYSDSVALSWHKACLLPRETRRQQCLSSKLQIDPEPVSVRERKDCFGNRTSHFSLQSAHQKLVVTATSDVVVKPAPDLSVLRNSPWEDIRLRLATPGDLEVLEALPFLHESPLVQGLDSLADYARVSFPSQRPLTEAARELMQRIYNDFKYDPGATSFATPVAEVMASRHGVCQDFAHLGVGCLRALGLAARYVSGYIETLPPPGKPRLVGADASHAWFSVYCGEDGWVDFDPTNNQVVSDQHVTLAWGRDFSDVSPVRGVALGGGGHQVEVSVDVARLPDQAA